VKKVRITDGNGVAYTTPQKLDGAGNKLNDDADPVTLTFAVGESVAFSPFGIG
jgi:hypothetical protein